MAKIGSLLAGVVALAACGEPVMHATSAKTASRPTMAMYAPAPPCRAAAVTDPRQLVPDTADAIIEVDAGRVFGSTAFAKVRAALEQDVDVAKVFGALSTCDLALTDLKTIVVATGPSLTASHGADRLLVVVEAKGIGERARLRCLSDALRGADPDPPWRVEGAKCNPELALSDGDARGFAVGPDVVAVASRPWLRAVRSRVAGKGRPVLRHGLAWTRGRVDMRDPVWFAVNVDPAGSMASTFVGVSTGLRRLGGSVDLTSGVSASLTAGYDAAPSANAAHAELQRVVGQMKAVIPMMGMSPALADSLQVSRAKNDVSLELDASFDDLEAILGIVAPGPAPSTPPSEPPPRRRGI